MIFDSFTDIFDIGAIFSIKQQGYCFYSKIINLMKLQCVDSASTCKSDISA